MMKYKSLRRISRERALQVLYAYTMNPENLETLISGNLIDISDDRGKEFARGLIEKAIIYRIEFDSLIEKYLLNWELDRLAVIDRVILYIGLCEFLHFDDIPPAVTINECIELAKEFCSDESGRFINGTLDKLQAELLKNGMMVKSGRGLIATPKRNI